MNVRKMFTLMCAAAICIAPLTACGSDESNSDSAEIVAENHDETTTTKKTTTTTKKTTTTTKKAVTTTETTSETTGESSSETSGEKQAGTVVYDGTADAAAAEQAANGNSNSSGNSNNNSSGNSNSNGDSNSSGNSNSSGDSNSNASGDSNSNNSSSGNSSNSDSNSSSGNSSNGDSNSSGGNAEEIAADLADEEEVHTMITLSDSGVTVSDMTGLSVSGTTVTITAEGKYEFTGTVSNGQILVQAGKDAKVDLYLNGVSIKNSSSAPIYVVSADTCTLHLVSGSTNYVADTNTNEKNAAIFSKDDLTIKGSGTLTVVGNKKHAIKSSNDVKIKNGTLSIAAVSAGIYGKDSVQMSGGNVTITTCKDGIKASGDEDDGTANGYVSIEDGYLNVENATGNGIQADASIQITGGSVWIHSVKKGLNCNNAAYVEGCYNEY